VRLQTHLLLYLGSFPFLLGLEQLFDAFSNKRIFNQRFVMFRLFLFYKEQRILLYPPHRRGHVM
jgi:hypothetical protein